jgi:hypothetical protein
MKKLIYLTLLVSVFFACQKDDCNKKDIYYNVNEKGRSMIPYSGYDTLTYIRTNIGDTHTFIGTGKKTTYDVQSEAADCGNTLYYEKYYYTYKSHDFNDLIIGQYTGLNSSYEGNTYVDFNNQIFMGYINFNIVKIDLDSLEVLGKVYTKIETIPSNENHKAFFNKDYGCIKMVFTNGDTWELLNFKK